MFFPAEIIARRTPFFCSLESVYIENLCAEAGQLGRQDLCRLAEAAQNKGTMVRAITSSARLQLRDGMINLYVYDDGTEINNGRELTALLQLKKAAVAFPGDLALQGVQQFVEKQVSITFIIPMGKNNRLNLINPIPRQTTI